MPPRLRSAQVHAPYHSTPFTPEEKQQYRSCWRELVANDIVHPIDTGDVVAYTEALVAAMADERRFRSRLAVRNGVVDLPRSSRKWRCLYAFVRSRTVANIVREYRRNAVRTVELGALVDVLRTQLIGRSRPASSVPVRSAYTRGNSEEETRPRTPAQLRLFGDLDS